MKTIVMSFTKLGKESANVARENFERRNGFVEPIRTFQYNGVSGRTIIAEYQMEEASIPSWAYNEQKMGISFDEAKSLKL